MERKDYWYNPTHIFLDDSLYFITAAIYKKRCLLQSPELKELLLTNIQENFKRYQWELHHWVILDNHYHLLGKSRKGQDLAQIIKNIHSASAYHIKASTLAQRPIWWNYWDYCPRNEQDYLTHLNYLFNNPIKHRYVDNLNDYPFSSFHLSIESQGREALCRQFKKYPAYKSLYLADDF